MKWENELHLRPLPALWGVWEAKKWPKTAKNEFSGHFRKKIVFAWKPAVLCCDKQNMSSGSQINSGQGGARRGPQNVKFVKFKETSSIQIATKFVKVRFCAYEHSIQYNTTMRPMLTQPPICHILGPPPMELPSKDTKSSILPSPSPPHPLHHVQDS